MGEGRTETTIWIESIDGQRRWYVVSADVEAIALPLALHIPHHALDALRDASTGGWDLVLVTAGGRPDVFDAAREVLRIPGGRWWCELDPVIEHEDEWPTCQIRERNLDIEVRLTVSTHIFLELIGTPFELLPFVGNIMRFRTWNDPGQIEISFDERSPHCCGMTIFAHLIHAGIITQEQADAILAIGKGGDCG